MKRSLCLVTLAILCLGQTLGPAVSAQPPDRFKSDHLGVVWPSSATVRDSSGSNAGVALNSELIAEVADPQGDMSVPLGWMRWPEPTRSVSAGADSFRFDLPLFMLHSPQSSFSWSLDSRAAADGTLHDSLDEQGTWQPGGSSVVPDPVDSAVNDYADLTQASIQTLDPQHLRFEVQVRGNTAGAWDREMYMFSLFPFSTQEWDTWVYLLPSDNPPQTW